VITARPSAGFVPGHRLSAVLYRDCVQPIIEREFPRLPYAAALIGHGSDVLGYDTERSSDHDWGPRLHILVDEADREQLSAPILSAVESSLPQTILGIPVDLPGASHLPDNEITHHNSPETGRHHGVIVTSIEQQLLGLLGSPEPPDRWDAARWLTVPQQGLLEFTAGPVHHDAPGHLTQVRSELGWYPHHLWLYLMAGRWQRIGQVEPFVGRCAELGDDLGSRTVAAQIVRDAMRLALLQHRRYAPYPKWLGTAFARAEIDAGLSGPLTAALEASTAGDRQRAVVDALLELSRRHDSLGVTERVASRAETFFDRPYLVIWAERHARALHDAVEKSGLAQLPYGLGGIDEITDSTDALGNGAFRRQVAAMYRG
jgi:hypothetical protein